MRRSSSPPKQNHSSIVSFIGDNFIGELNKLMMVLSKQHCHKCTLTHQKIINLSNERRILIRDLITQYPDSEELKSAQYLNIKGHKLFISIVSDILSYIHTLGDDVNHLVYCVGHEDYPRKFSTIYHRCNGVDLIANENQCVHEFVLHQKFIPKYWSTLYRFR